MRKGGNKEVSKDVWGQTQMRKHGLVNNELGLLQYMFSYSSVGEQMTSETYKV